MSVDSAQQYRGLAEVSHPQPRCLSPMTPRICEGCDSVVTDLYIIKVVSKDNQHEQYWHERCLKCSMCGQQMTGRCYDREGRLYCQSDYEKLFSGRCSRCHNAVKNLEMVMRSDGGLYYHVGCFSCCVCNRLLSAGDLYSVDRSTEGIYCQHHSLANPQLSFSPEFSLPVSDRSPSSLNPLIQFSHSCDDFPRPGDLGRFISDSASYWSDDPSEDQLTNMSGCAKADKRPRTVLSATQRCILKHAFDLDPKPSKKARHIMAMETGLTNRVVQVWFQNQRAKMKKRQKSGTFRLDSPASPEPSGLLAGQVDSPSPYKIAVCADERDEADVILR